MYTLRLNTSSQVSDISAAPSTEELVLQHGVQDMGPRVPHLYHSEVHRRQKGKQSVSESIDKCFVFVDMI